MITPYNRDKNSNNDEFLKNLANLPLLQGTTLDVNLEANKAKLVYPRPIRGWIIIGQTTQADIWGQSTPQGLSLTASSSTTLKVWVF
jgi:hypothetical protein